MSRICTITITTIRGSEDEYYKYAQPRKPVGGTVARGYAGIASAQSTEEAMATMQMLDGESSHNAISVPVNGSVPYYYGDTDDERARATAEIINNPFPITDEGIARGKELYKTFCAICHGEKADGNGWIVAEDNPNAAYPAQPANLLSEEFINASNGRYYHVLMQGKGVMGAYADKVSYEERWQIIHYLRTLHAKEVKLAY
ncbi:MAG: c-type cytochrome, partial [Bacteroidota bacterium]